MSNRRAAAYGSMRRPTRETGGDSNSQENAVAVTVTGVTVTVDGVPVTVT